MWYFKGYYWLFAETELKKNISKEKTKHSAWLHTRQGVYNMDIICPWALPHLQSSFLALHVAREPAHKQTKSSSNETAADAQTSGGHWFLRGTGQQGFRDTVRHPTLEKQAGFEQTPITHTLSRPRHRFWLETTKTFSHQCSMSFKTGDAQQQGSTSFSSWKTSEDKLVSHRDEESTKRPCNFKTLTEVTGIPAYAVWSFKCFLKSFESFLFLPVQAFWKAPRSPKFVEKGIPFSCLFNANLQQTPTSLFLNVSCFKKAYTLSPERSPFKLAHGHKVLPELLGVCDGFQILAGPPVVFLVKAGPSPVPHVRDLGPLQLLSLCAPDVGDNIRGLGQLQKRKLHRWKTTIRWLSKFPEDVNLSLQAGRLSCSAVPEKISRRP